jgi:predicted transcriptional regulator
MNTNLKVNIDPKLRKALEAEAKRTDRSVSALIRVAIREYLERNT